MRVSLPITTWGRLRPRPLACSRCSRASTRPAA
ncbi:Uncharacterised protein [Bordetella pertussis]|nr:Uncharacterised protein [Bordetella pertussis]